MIDEYGCDANDFICKVNARQASANQPTAIQSNIDGGSSDYAPQPYSPMTQDQKDFNLADTVAQNQQARNSWNGQSNNETMGNIMGIPMSVANVMKGGYAIPLGTVARGAGNAIQGINPFDTQDTFDWYKGDTSSQGAPIGPYGAHERGMQGTYGNQYEKDIVGMFGEGSTEHMNAIQNQFDNVETVQPQGGWLNGVVEGLLGVITGGSSDDETPDGNNGVNNNGGGGSSNGNSGFHGADHNWN